MYTVIIDKKFYSTYSRDFEIMIRKILLLLQDLETEYPSFNSWFYRVLKGIGEGKRSIIVKMVDSNISGVAILKHTRRQQKICTFRILPKYQRLGIGSDLMSDSLYLLKNTTPVASVSEHRIGEFKPFLYKNNFEEIQQLDSYYWKNQTEHVFNGMLEEKVNYYFQFV